MSNDHAEATESEEAAEDGVGEREADTDGYDPADDGVNPEYEMNEERIVADLETPEEKLPVEWVPRSQLEPNDWNPNEMGDSKEDELVFSLRDNGWTQPIVTLADTDIIVDGQQRWNVTAKPVMTTDGVYKPLEDDNLTPEGVPAGHVPIFELDVDDTQARVATMQHNQARGDHDVDKLADLLADLQDRGMVDEAADHMNIDPPSLERLLDRASTVGGAPGPGEIFDIPWEEGAPDQGDDDMRGAFVERIDLLITEDEMVEVKKVLKDELQASLFVEMCRIAVDEDIIEETKYELLSLKDDIENDGTDTGEETDE